MEPDQQLDGLRVFDYDHVSALAEGLSAQRMRLSDHYPVVIISCFLLIISFIIS